MKTKIPPVKFHEAVLLFAMLFAPWASCTSRASTYSQDFTLTDSFGTTPFRVQNAFLRTEPFGTPVRYWQPTTPNLWGEVVYRFNIGFSIGAASSTIAVNAYTSGADVNFDNGAEGYVDVSADDINYTNVLGSYPGRGGGAGPLGDFSALVHNADVIYVRARLYMTTNYASFGTAQFLRSDPGISFNVTASSVPEPSTTLLLTVALCGVSQRRRRRCSVR